MTVFFGELTDSKRHTLPNLAVQRSVREQRKERGDASPFDREPCWAHMRELKSRIQKATVYSWCSFKAGDSIRGPATSRGRRRSELSPSARHERHDQPIRITGKGTFTFTVGNHRVELELTRLRGM